jgi:hypothetical protein
MAKPKRDDRWVTQGPAPNDWGVFGISLLFVLGGIWLMWRGQVANGGFTVLFFGLGVVLFGARILRLLRASRPGLQGAKLPGGVEIGLSSWRFYGIGAALIAIGAAGLLSDWPRAAWLAALLWFTAGAGAVVIAGMALKLFPRQSIMLTPQGLVVRVSGVRFRMPWARVERLVSGDIANNPMVGLRMGPAGVEPLDSDPARVARVTDRYFDWMGCEFGFMPLQYGLDPQLTLAALTGYVEDPASRQDLARAPRVAARP